MTTHPHGHYLRYRQDGCRCLPCRRANTLQHADWRKRNYLAGGSLLVARHGVVRRIRALMALGWTAQHLADRLGRSRGAVLALAGYSRQRCTLATHQAVAALYDELCMTTPTPADDKQRGYIERGRRQAKAKGWLPPLAWDDIDDPDERPDLTDDDDLVDYVVVERILAGERLPATRPERVEVVRRWRAAGRPAKELERRTGWKVERYYERQTA